MYARRLLSIAGIIAFSLNTIAQDPGFTQFYANPIYLNPAFAGSALCPRIHLNYRNQWPAISGTFTTYSASYDQHVRKLGGGLGLLVLHDQAGQGTLNTTQISGIYSYGRPITRKFSMKAGVEVSYRQKMLDWSKLTFGDQIEPGDGFVNNTKEIPGSNQSKNLDISTGILGYSKKYFLGVAVHHLTEPNEALIGKNLYGDKVESRLPRKYTAHAGAMIPLDGRGGDTYLSPNILYQQQQDFKQLNLGLYVIKGPMVAGLWYRNRDSFIALVGFQQGLYKFGYSYDITISKLSNATAGSHELSFAMQFKCKPPKRTLTPVDCFTF